MGTMAKGRVARFLFVVAFVAGHLVTLVDPFARWSFLDVWVVIVPLTSVIGYVRIHKRFPQGNTANLIGIFIVVSALATLVRGGAVSVSEFLYIGRWVMYAGVYVYMRTLSKKEQNAWLIALFVAGVALSGIGLLQLWLYPDLRNLEYIGWDPHYLRVFSTVFDPNFAGIVFALSIVLGLSLTGIYSKYKRAIGLGISILFVALIFTYSRSSYAGIIAGMVVWLASTKSYRALAIFLGVFLFSVLFLPYRGWESQDLLRTTSAAARIGSMRMGWEMFTTSPVFGVGFKQERVLPDVVHVPVQRTGSIDTSLLYVLAALGIPGFLAYVSIWARLFQTGVRVMRQSPLGPLLYTSVITLLVHGVFTNSLLYPWAMVWIWTIAGVTEQEVTADT